MDYAFAERLLEESSELSTLPQTMTEVLRLARDDRSSADDMAQVIMRDPTLTTDILKIVNSPFFGVPRRIGSVTQAVVLIGVREVTAVALSASVYRITAGWSSPLDRKHFWRHSLEVAIAARMIAEHLRYPHPEELFVAGLLHDLGMLAIAHVFPAEAEGIWQEAERDGDLLQAEQKAWRTDHAEAGQFLLSQWFLPDTICLAAGLHHQMELPNKHSAESAPVLIVQLAHAMAKFVLRAETRHDQAVRHFKEQLREHLRIPAETLFQTEKSLFSRVLAEAKYLDMDVGSADEIMQETHQLLFEQFITVERLMAEIDSLQELVRTAKAAPTN